MCARLVNQYLSCVTTEIFYYNTYCEEIGAEDGGNTDTYNENKSGLLNDVKYLIFRPFVHTLEYALHSTKYNVLSKRKKELKRQKNIHVCKSG